MIRLHNITFRKLIHYPTFWILLVLHLVLANLVILGMENFLSSIEINGSTLSKADLSKFGIFTFPDIWHNITYVTGYFKFILALIIIIDVCNDFSYRTIRQHIIDGLSYREYLGTKFLLMLWLALVSTVFLTLTGMYLGYNHSVDSSNALVLEKIGFIGGYFIEILTYLSLALLIGLVVKRSGLSIGLLVLYTWIIEPLITFFLPDNLQKFLPLENLDNMIQVPFKDFLGAPVQENIQPLVLLIAIFYIFLFNFLAYLNIRYKDL